ncbi:hypothetical protein CLOLEP_00509 [[Clostridium] leptum DSM 753]|uniref:Uncharacterized protein n=1 Tax=[Clostridium] leptum DSM 753 TaxID=428125 RepID=A7VPN3_9FIRM|nr:hypothetical protein CLOLEP_00509 [[Clostridium] leptum DSM 753]
MTLLVDFYCLLSFAIDCNYIVNCGGKTVKIKHADLKKHP